MSDRWIVAHVDLADEAFSSPLLDRLKAIRERLAGHGYTLKLDIGKRTTKATVTRPGLRAKSTYRNLDAFMESEEARLTQMDALRSKVSS